ncbi:MAG: lipid II flippase MurJ, partial [Candidatus Peregrinibacteria bacterium]
QYILFTRILLISPVLFGLSNLYGKMMLSFKEFLWYGLSPAFYNLGIVIGAAVLAPRFGPLGLVAGPLLGALMHVSLRFINVRRPKIGFRHALDFTLSPEVKETLKLTAPKIVQYGMWAFLMASFTRIASQLPEGSVSVYNYARNFQSIPVSLIGVAIALAMYPGLSHDAAKGNFEKFRIDFRQGHARCMFYTTLAAIVLALLGKPIISLLLGGGAFDENQASLLAKVLAVYCLSVPLESLMHAYHRTYYALRNTMIPALVHAVMILGTIVMAKILAPIIGVYAIPLSFAGGLMVHIGILALAFPSVFQKAAKNEK